MTLPRIPTFDELCSVCAAKGYRQPFEGDRNIFIFGIRNAVLSVVDKFNDLLGYTWEVDGQRLVRTFPATTKPGLYYLLNPDKGASDGKGTGILVEGQYNGCYTVGDFNGEASLLQTLGKVAVYRDNDADGEFDLHRDSIEWGYFGIFMHQHFQDWSVGDVAQQVWNSSAACQVPQSHADIKELVAAAALSESIYGKGLTYTLFNETDFLAL